MPYINYQQIINHLNINAGDKLFVSSDIKALMFSCYQNGEAFDGNLFIESIIDKLGDNGTLVFPTYNWDFCKGVAFDYYKTKSQVGALTNVALKRTDFKRTNHPIYSFAVWGKDKAYLCSMNNISSFGGDSPFAYFYNNYFKNLFIAVDYHSSMTFAHHCEEKVGVPYRFLKDFTSHYIDDHGTKNERTYSMYVRPLDKKVEPLGNPMHEIFLQNNVVKTYEINEILYNLLDMRGAYDLVECDIIHNKSRNIAIYEGQ